MSILCRVEFKTEVRVCERKGLSLKQKIKEWVYLNKRGEVSTWTDFVKSKSGYLHLHILLKKDENECIIRKVDVNKAQHSQVCGD